MQYKGEKKQLGLFFFSEQDAQELIEQVSAAVATTACAQQTYIHSASNIANDTQNMWQCQPAFLVSASMALMSKCHMQVREQNPELGKDSHIQQVGMDAVYAMADKGNNELSFRFMPDAEQVQHAMQVCHVAMHPCC